MHELASDKQRPDGTDARKRWLSALASAPDGRIRALWNGVKDAGGVVPDYSFVRAPEIGLVMTRGRMGGTGNAFNLTEMTVTRCSVRLSDGTLGHGYVAGRGREAAEIAAVCDALLQRPEDTLSIGSTVIEPLITERAARDARRARKAAATRVEFFTMVRGDNE